MIGFIIGLLVVGLIAGAIARLLMPGRDPLGILGTIVLGIAGSFVGGFLQNLVEYHSLSIHGFHTVGFIGSIIGAWVLLLYFGVVTVIDLEQRLILHPVSLVGAVIGLVVGFWLHGWVDTLAGGAAGFLMMFLLAS